MLAPIVLFVYNRPANTRATLESLRKCTLANQSELFIFSDGPKSGATNQQLKQIKKVRKILRSSKWCKKITIYESKCNKGLANSVIDGVTKIINKYGRVIVLEDDLVVSNQFLIYMNENLDRYEKNNKVVQIAGFQSPVRFPTDKDAFFLPFISSWGWASWKRVWDRFDRTGSGIEKLRGHKELIYKFNHNGSSRQFKMLEMQQAGLIDSWAIRFSLSTFLQKGLTLYPRRSMVFNNGFGNGTNTRVYLKQDPIDNSFRVKTNDEVVVRQENEKILYRYTKLHMSFLSRGFRFMLQYVLRVYKNPK